MAALLTVILISTITFFRNIASFPLRNWDEAWYSEIIKNMAGGHYSLLAPFWNGRYYFDKPPLYFWLSAPIVRVFGIGAWQTRLISDLAAVGATILIFLIAKKLSNLKAAVFSSLVFLTLGQVVIRFAHGNLDALLICSFLLTFNFYLLAEKKLVFAILAGVSTGLGLLIKGWLVGLYPALIITLFSLFTRKKLPANWLLILTAAAISASWYYLAGALKFGRPFINWYFFSPAGGLLTSPITSFSLTYIKDLIRDIGFWWLAVLASIALKSKISLKERNVIISFALSASLFIFPLNFLSEKLGWYNLPAYPLLAIIIGILLSKIYSTVAKATILFAAILIALQITNVILIENIYPDRSKIGANLGKIAAQMVPKDEKIILDDKDFTAFLFYSNHQQILVALPEGGKNWEWWIIKYQDIAQFAQSNPHTWIITPRPADLPIDQSQAQVMTIDQGYTFLRF